MSGRSGIEWTDRTWNPVVGCTKVSQGCKLCYAKTIHDMRHAAYLAGKKVAPQYAHPFETVQLVPDRLRWPLSLRQPSRIFVNSVSDLFHEDVPDDFIDRVFAVMALAERHTFQVLTKRPERMRAYLREWCAGFAASEVLIEPDDLALMMQSGDPIETPGWVRRPWPLPNVWLGVSVENQEAFHERVPELLHTPAAVRFLSCEPLLGPIDLGESIKVECCGKSDIINWVIVGGESGSLKQNPRPMHPDWARSIRDQCTDAGVPFLFKQWGEWAGLDNDGIGGAEDVRNISPIGEFVKSRDDSIVVVRLGKKRAGRVLDGRTWDEYPQAVPA